MLLTGSFFRCLATLRLDTEIGVQDEESGEEGAYLLNVAVDPEWRSKGCGKAMLLFAEKLISTRWDAKRIYTHVANSNVVFSGLDDFTGKTLGNG